MTNYIPPDLYALIQKVKQEQLDDFVIDITKNSKGEGYIGDVVFVVLTNKKTGEKQNLSIKQQKVLDGKPIDWSNQPFENEIYFYNSVWPTLHEFYFEKTGKSLDFIPKCLGTSLDGVKSLVMENLKSINFKNYDKTKIFKKDHLEKIFKTYGIYHGISMSLKEEKFEEFSRLVNGMHLDIWRDMFKAGALLDKSLLYHVRECICLFDSEKEKHLYNKIVEYEKMGSDIIYNLYDQDKTGRVIKHGDCWSNNLMFRYDVSI